MINYALCMTVYISQRTYMYKYVDNECQREFNLGSYIFLPITSNHPTSNVSQNCIKSPWLMIIIQSVEFNQYWGIWKVMLIVTQWFTNVKGSIEYFQLHKENISKGYILDTQS